MGEAYLAYQSASLHLGGASVIAAEVYYIQLEANMSERTITIIGREDTEDRALLGTVRDWMYAQEKVSIRKLKSALSGFTSNMGEILDGLPDEVAGYKLESIDVSLEISAKGNVSLMAIGGEAGGTGGLILHLKKKPSMEK